MISDWVECIDWFYNKSIDGFKDWRIPNKEELKFVYNNESEFSNLIDIELENYWTSSEYDEDDDDDRAIGIEFSTGRDNVVKKTKLLYSRPVRLVKI